VTEYGDRLAAARGVLLDEAGAAVAEQLGSVAARVLVVHQQRGHNTDACCLVEQSPRRERLQHARVPELGRGRQHVAGVAGLDAARRRDAAPLGGLQRQLLVQRDLECPGRRDAEAGQLLQIGAAALQRGRRLVARCEGRVARVLRQPVDDLLGVAVDVHGGRCEQGAQVRVPGEQPGIARAVAAHGKSIAGRAECTRNGQTAALAAVQDQRVDPLAQRGLPTGRSPGRAPRPA
jgi:hypothetical protein